MGQHLDVEAICYEAAATLAARIGRGRAPGGVAEQHAQDLRRDVGRVRRIRDPVVVPETGMRVDVDDDRATIGRCNDVDAGEGKAGRRRGCEGQPSQILRDRLESLVLRDGVLTCHSLDRHGTARVRHRSGRKTLATEREHGVEVDDERCDHRIEPRRRCATIAGAKPSLVLRFGELRDRRASVASDVWRPAPNAVDDGSVDHEHPVYRSFGLSLDHQQVVVSSGPSNRLSDLARLPQMACHTPPVRTAGRLHDTLTRLALEEVDCMRRFGRLEHAVIRDSDAGSCEHSVEARLVGREQDGHLVVERNRLVVYTRASGSLADLHEAVAEIDDVRVDRVRGRRPHVVDGRPLTRPFALRMPHVERHATKRMAATGRQRQVDPRDELVPRAGRAAELDRPSGAPHRRAPADQRVGTSHSVAQPTRQSPLAEHAIRRWDALTSGVDSLSENGTPASCDVLHVVWAGLYGGIQTQLATLVRAIDSRPGPTHRVCFLEGTGRLADRLIAEGLAFRLGFRGGWDPRDLSRFFRSLRRAHPSVIHFHSPVLAPALVATAGADATCVFTQHGLRTEIQNRIFYSVVRRRFATFIIAAPTLRSRLERYGVPPDRILHLPYPLTVPTRSAPDSGGSNGRRVVGIAARLEREKRVDVFVDVIAELRARGVDCAGVVVGDGSLRAEVEAHARSLRVDEDVSFVGAHENLVEWLDGFDVCLMTSDKDVYPLIAIEAMARGVPLVAMPCDGGLPDLATRGGLLLPDRDPSTAAAALIGVFESPQKRAELRTRGSAVAAEHAVENVIPLYEAFYESVRRRQVARA